MVIDYADTLRKLPNMSILLLFVNLIVGLFEATVSLMIQVFKVRQREIIIAIKIVIIG